LTLPEVRVVAAWHEALNGGDAERLVGLSHPDIEVGGPRGTGRGAQLLRDWVLRAGIHLVPRRIFHQRETVVVEQEAGWGAAGTGETSGNQTVASVFVVRDGLVVSVARHPDLAEALRAAGIEGSQELSAAHGMEARGTGGAVGEL